ncbi:Low molecular weight protein-tyrosine-phosphatase YfkJ [Linum perenne]
MAETHSTTKPFSVLFVCLGNICRSPAAEGVFRDIVHKKGLDSKFNIDSAGTINYHEVHICMYTRCFSDFWDGF